MDRPNTPSRPPDYALPNYDDDDMDDSTPTGNGAAAVRLLTTVQDSEPDYGQYVVPSDLVLPPPPLVLKSEKPLQYSIASPKRQRGGPATLKQVTWDASVQSPRRKPVASNLPQKRATVKLQKRAKPEAVVEAEIAHNLPMIPEGPSPRRAATLKKSSSTTTTPARTIAPLESIAYSHNDKPSIRPTARSYQSSIHSQRSSILDPPSMPPPDSTYIPYSGSAAGVSYRPSRESISPTRPWTPSRGSSEFPRGPPSPVHYEPADINGSPRPGTPSSRYGGSPRRPLPPAPLFSTGRNSTFVDDATVSIPLDGDDDVFGGPTASSDLGDPRLRQRESYQTSAAQSAVTLNDEEDDDYYTEFDEKHTTVSGSKVEHYGPAPEGKQERRGVRQPLMSKKEVQLINGELVLECKIPTILYSFLPRRDEVEFTHMRYTAVTCDPDDFVDRGYKLRQNIGRTARETELFICITMYNEDEYGFTRTMHAVMKNISHFCSRNKSRTWGEAGWQKIVVCVVSDGREKIHPRTLDALAAMGVYQHGIAKNYVNNKAVQAHVYEYTTQVSLDADLKFKGAEKGIVPCQMIFCLKERNQRKLNSHRWFFNAFGKALNPNVCILLDVGTRPGGNSLYHLWKAFDTDSNVAGACGEIKAMKGKFGVNLLNPLVASQNFEYKMSNILDKPLESVFGYITVLPGALSAYRYHALQNDETGHGPLSQYFKGETLHGQHADVFTANMYLAEDRILCWELVAKRGERWVLKYVKGCTGETDVPGESSSFRSNLTLCSNKQQTPSPSSSRSAAAGSTAPSSRPSTRSCTSSRSGRRTTPWRARCSCTSSSPTSSCSCSSPTSPSPTST